MNLSKPVWAACRDVPLVKQVSCREAVRCSLTLTLVSTVHTQASTYSLWMKDNEIFIDPHQHVSLVTPITKHVGKKCALPTSDMFCLRFHALNMRTYCTLRLVGGKDFPHQSECQQDRRSNRTLTAILANARAPRGPTVPCRDEVIHLTLQKPDLHVLRWSRCKIRALTAENWTAAFEQFVLEKWPIIPPSLSLSLSLSRIDKSTLSALRAR